MRKGLMIGATEGPDNSIDGLIKAAQEAESRGFDDVWMANIFSFDAISALSIVGRETKTIGLGTAVTPTYPRHPTAIAQQALTAGAAAPDRFSLGIGLSHKIVIEDMLGFSYDKPARHMREYLSILGPLMKGETVSFKGEQYNINNVTIAVPGSGEVPLLVAALGNVMLKLAGQMADGTITWMTGPKTLEEHIIPRISAGAKDAGKKQPSIVAGFPVVLTNDVNKAREDIGKMLEIYGVLPSYRAMLDKEGLSGPGDIAIAGDEKTIESELARLESMGVTHFSAAIAGSDAESYQRTMDFLASLNN